MYIQSNFSPAYSFAKLLGNAMSILTDIATSPTIFRHGNNGFTWHCTDISKQWVYSPFLCSITIGAVASAHVGQCERSPIFSRNGNFVLISFPTYEPEKPMLIILDGSKLRIGHNYFGKPPKPLKSLISEYMFFIFVFFINIEI